MGKENVSCQNDVNVGEICKNTHLLALTGIQMQLDCSLLRKPCTKPSLQTQQNRGKCKVDDQGAVLCGCS